MRVDKQWEQMCKKVLNGLGDAKVFSVDGEYNCFK